MVKTLKNNKIVGNFFSLASIQVLNYILPVVTLPYLMRVLDLNSYGAYGVAQAMTQYFILFTDYGFNLTATRDISKQREDKKRVSEIFSSVMSAKVLLLVVSFVILVLISLIVPNFRKNILLNILTFGMVVGSVLFPTWFFQGIEEMKVSALLNALSKIFFTIGIFMFVKAKGDIYLVAILNSLGYIIAGCIALGIAIFKYKVRFVRPSFKQIRGQMREGWDIFVSNIASSIYTIGNTLLLGAFTNNTITAYYTGADKIITACSSVISPIIQAVYPHVSRLMNESKIQVIKLTRKIWIGITIVIGAGCVVLLFFSGWIFPIVFGEKYNDSIILIQIMSFLPLIRGWTNVFGVLTMINFGYQRFLSKIYFFASMISLVTMPVLIYFLQDKGAALNLTMIELGIMISMYVLLRKKEINIPKGTIKIEE
ncbi:flippase [Isobaculum melis]|uniref:Polysaccharide transporter, PST family n=1 Tax=Isobaculum melis TaxID=142588 RepID=A0A1H9QPN8_9LACT|nr:flippase [Isobaculum melis]SER62466.1 polysaccharide transporter, PST family [Isobaculum melis]